MTKKPLGPDGPAGSDPARELAEIKKAWLEKALFSRREAFAKDAPAAIRAWEAQSEAFIRDLMTERDTLRAALRAAEWGGEAGFWEEAGCPVCRASQSAHGKHAPDCILGLALAPKPPAAGAESHPAGPQGPEK